MRKLLFSPYLPHLSLLYDLLRDRKKISFFADRRTIPYIRVNDMDDVIFTPIHFYGLDKMRDRLNLQTSVPLKIKNFSRLVTEKDLKAMILFDFYHWYSLQAINYCKKNPEVKVFIYSETKKWPTNWLTRKVMRVFVNIVKRNAEHIGGVIVYTEAGRQWWKENIPEVRVSVLPVPIDVKKFRPIENKLWLPNGTLRILMNARYSAFKRHEDLLKATEELLRQGRQVKVTFIGRDDGGRNKVERLVEHYGLKDVVRFLDPLPAEEMPDLCHNHDVLVLPSYNEAIGMVVPEAMACGLPTITSDTVGANVYVEDGLTGWIFETGNVTKLVEAMDKCFDEATLMKQSKYARDTITSQFTPQQIADQFLDFVEQS